jgi:hypothetical protein
MVDLDFFFLNSLFIFCHMSLKNFMILEVGRGKSKCGATVGWLVLWVAPLLILPKRWLFLPSYFCCSFVALSSF